MVKQRWNLGGTVTWGMGAEQTAGFQSTMLSSRQGYVGRVGVTMVHLGALGQRRMTKGLGAWAWLEP